MKNPGFVIAIGRQFGSGARAVAKELAARLNINQYDKQLLDSAASRFGYQSGIFANADEKKPSAFRSILSHAYGVPEAYHVQALSPERIYSAQSEIISHIADNENCVIVGRTADHVLRNHPGLLSVFLHASIPYRVNNIISRGDASNEKEALEMISKIDKNRKKYYDYFTDRHWGQADNYHLSIDATKLTTSQIADLIIYHLNLSGTKVE